MCIETPEELHGMEAAGRAVRAVLNAMKAAVREDITTRELDAVGEVVMLEHGARSGPRSVYQFPGANCISVNEEIVHGVPGDRKLKRGDLVSLDVTLEVNGFMADACETVSVGPPTAIGSRLLQCVQQAFAAGMAAVRPGVRAHDIGRAVDQVTRRAGYSVVRELTGHGIGRTIHEPPTIPNYFDPQFSDVLVEGLVFTIEPMIAVGTHRTVTLKDGWTVRTRDRSLSAHFEHTLIVTKDGARILTA